MYEFFERLLQERGLTSAEVCAATGIGQATISAWKKRRGILGAEYLLKLSKYFKVPMEYFMGGDCVSWDDEMKEVVQTDDYYISDDAKEMAQFLFQHPEYKVLFDASRKVKPEDLKKAITALGLVINED